MKQKAKNDTKNNNKEIWQENAEELVLLVTTIRCKLKSITIFRQVVLKVMSETPV